MGSCVSKDSHQAKVGDRANRQAATNSAANASGRKRPVPPAQAQANGGHVLGGSSNGDQPRGNAALAAEQRYRQQQEKTKESQTKLKAMKQMSRLEKNLG